MILIYTGIFTSKQFKQFNNKQNDDIRNDYRNNGTWWY